MPPALPQSGAELAALAAARLALQEAALAAHFEATVGAPLATLAVRLTSHYFARMSSRHTRPQAQSAAALPPPYAPGAAAELEAHAEACRLAHSLLLRGTPGARAAAVIARREL